MMFWDIGILKLLFCQLMGMSITANPVAMFMAINQPSAKSRKTQFRVHWWQHVRRHTVAVEQIVYHE